MFSPQIYKVRAQRNASNAYKEDLMPDINEAKEVHAQLDALLELLLEKKVNKVKNQF